MSLNLNWIVVPAVDFHDLCFLLIYSESCLTGKIANALRLVLHVLMCWRQKRNVVWVIQFTCKFLCYTSAASFGCLSHDPVYYHQENETWHHITLFHLLAPLLHLTGAGAVDDKDLAVRCSNGESSDGNTFWVSTRNWTGDPSHQS